MLAFWCVALFITIGKGTPAIFDPPKRFVIKGPYRYVRNPMVIGVLLMLIGEAVYFHSTGILIYASVLCIIIRNVVVRVEEKDLERRFGNEYIEYKRSINRWLPKFKRLQK